MLRSFYAVELALRPLGAPLGQPRRVRLDAACWFSGLRPDGCALRRGARLRARCCLSAAPKKVKNAKKMAKWLRGLRSKSEKPFLQEQ